MANKQSGQVIILSLIFMLVVLMLVGALLSLVFQNVSATRRAVAKEQALQLADAGIDKAVWKLNQTAGSYVGETGTMLGTGVFDVAISNISGTEKEITATGYVPNKTSPIVTKQTKVRVNISTTTVNFNYGVHVGEGGLRMFNNSKVIGNVFSNGNIDGDPGATITGDAFSAGTAGFIEDVTVQGTAYAHLIQEATIGANAKGTILTLSTVNGNAFAHTISNCTIVGNASFTVRTACSIGGTQTTPYPGEPDPLPQPFPISNAQITNWKNAAAGGGTIVGDYILPGNGSASLGPKKITGKLIISNNAQLTITGPIWVENEIVISNNAVIRLNPSYGNIGEVIISDFKVNISNNVVFQRAGPNSYIMIITTSNLPNDALKVANNADSLIVYAPNGGIEISNNALLREVTGWRVLLKNNAQITYEAGLANTLFSGGPGASWQILRSTWREIK